MEQRRVRLGDILDDYCPRERRVTNHAVVAMIEDQIRQTRCTACDSEHPYKAARVPRSRKKQTPAALYATVLAARTGEDAAASGNSPMPTAAEAIPEQVEAADDEVAAVRAEAPQPDAPAIEAAPPSDEPAPAAGAIEDGPVRRPLIRATLPRPEGQQTTRPLPEFTMRQSGVRGGRLIDNDARGNARGGRPANNGSRPLPHGRHHSRPGHGHGRPHGPQHAGSRYDRPHGHGGRGQRPGPSTRGGKKRSR